MTDPVIPFSSSTTVAVPRTCVMAFLQSLSLLGL
jgi:hypothetical protein